MKTFNEYVAETTAPIIMDAVRKSDTTNINVFQKVIAEDKKKEMEA